ncbi:MAG: Rieske (2Fe-2S) protein [Pseudomonadales bacterium]|jgi:phenylpropionate dioxygenase-like ring-hydroxylating dioxygenase large terminal subunit|nr:Rieske (2Fe-2S) protein [Pseudomonadales bacterium]|tara:strand:- start:35 stop:511 length:477 start_codon:yes stop_codon:yes gene_type:complete
MYDLTGEDVPPALREQAAEFLGDEDVPFERYASEDVYEAEVEKVWAHTWQWACREERLRGADAKIRAFANCCPHRGMQIVGSRETGRGRQFLRCPFHGIFFELDGRLREIPCRWDFPRVQEENFGLDELPCDVWGGLVFVNPDKNASPLAEYLDGQEI